jgi:hypothetical protein
MIILQGNKLGTVLTDVNGREMIISAIDEEDNGINGTQGMTYTVYGDGKFTSQYLSQL